MLRDVPQPETSTKLPQIGLKARTGDVTLSPGSECAIETH